jgi:uncharacterized protein YjiS (DUF1127 family)
MNAKRKFVTGKSMTLKQSSEQAKGLVSAAAGLAGSPVRVWRASRRRFRRFLAFSAIDSHTLDDIGLRRSIFIAVPSDDKVHVRAHCGSC